MNHSVTTSPYESENSNTTESNNSLAESIELRKTFKGQKMKDKPRKLNYTFHNPNTPEETADFLIKLFVEVNLPKIEAAIKKYIQDQEKEEGCS